MRTSTQQQSTLSKQLIICHLSKIGRSIRQHSLHLQYFDLKISYTLYQLHKRRTHLLRLDVPRRIHIHRCATQRNLFLIRKGVLKLYALSFVTDTVRHHIPLRKQDVHQSRSPAHTLSHSQTRLEPLHSGFS